MGIFGFRDASIKMKLLSIISILILFISVFVYFYFPAKQESGLNKGFFARISTMTEMVALGCGIGLGTDQLIVLKNVFDWAKQDTSLQYIVVLNRDGKKITQYPKDLDNSIEELKSRRNGSVTNGVVNFTKNII